MTDLGPDAQASLDRLHHALGDSDPATLLPLLSDTHAYLQNRHARSPSGSPASPTTPTGSAASPIADANISAERPTDPSRQQQRSPSWQRGTAYGR
ncbi:hypothetical protein ACIBSW_27245 [Actinoplanes sp. NPDC049668]|uniref:hypothetical protein n=1 Tax=unclassified Actinoplanes TaxID=2626549 RepID=UPI0033AC31E8